jgi:hypothetical protein
LLIHVSCSLVWAAWRSKSTQYLWQSLKSNCGRAYCWRDCLYCLGFSAQFDISIIIIYKLSDGIILKLKSIILLYILLSLKKYQWLSQSLVAFLHTPFYVSIKRGYCFQVAFSQVHCLFLSLIPLALIVFSTVHLLTFALYLVES